MCALSSLMAINAPDELAVHFSNALQVGATQLEIREMIFRLMAYTGVPMVVEAFKSFNGVLASKGISIETETLQTDWDDDVRYEKGEANVMKLFGKKGAKKLGELMDSLKFSASGNVVSSYVVEYYYGKTFDYNSSLKEL